MPFMNGRGPRGAGKGAGRGLRRRGAGAGPSGECVCLACGARVVHKRGVPCSSEACPQCGGPMARE